MPETPIYKEDNPPGGENKVGPAGQLLGIKAKTIPEGMGGLPDDQFRFRVDRPNAAHVVAAGRRVEMINHDYHTLIVNAHSGLMDQPPSRTELIQTPRPQEGSAPDFSRTAPATRSEDLAGSDVLQTHHIAMRITRSRKSYSGSPFG
jgi:hypothetical protein